MLKSQRKKVIHQLKTRGFVSRNWCIYYQPRSEGGIIGLSSIIKTLKKEGWILEGRSAKTKWGKDFIYEIKKQSSLNL